MLFNCGCTWEPVWRVTTAVVLQRAELLAVMSTHRDTPSGWAAVEQAQLNCRCILFLCRLYDRHGGCSVRHPRRCSSQRPTAQPITC